MTKIDGGISSVGISGFIIHPCVSEISAFNMSLSMENIIKGLKEAMGMRSYLGLKEWDLGSRAQGHVGHSPISAVPPQLFRSAFPNLVKINLSNASPTAEQLAFLFSSLSPGGKITALNWEEGDLASVAGS